MVTKNRPITCICGRRFDSVRSFNKHRKFIEDNLDRLKDHAALQVISGSEGYSTKGYPWVSISNTTMWIDELERQEKKKKGYKHDGQRTACGPKESLQAPGVLGHINQKTQC